MWVTPGSKNGLLSSGGYGVVGHAVQLRQAVDFDGPVAAQNVMTFFTSQPKPWV